MSIQSIPRWQWITISIIVGILLWAVRRGSDGGLPATGICINDQRTFERQLLTSLGGQPLFKDVQVSRQTLDDGSGHPTPIYLILGKSCDGIVKEDGNYHWMPAFFVAHTPYRPTVELRFLEHPSVSDPETHWNSLRDPTVMDFLQLAGLHYTSAWWNTYPFVTWLGGSVLLLGVIWPSVINLVLYRSLLRPREPRGITLRGVLSTPPIAAVPISGLNLDHLRELEQKLASAAVAPSSPHEETGVPISQVDYEPAVTTEVEKHKSFRAKPEDFYPTEERTRNQVKN